MVTEEGSGKYQYYLVNFVLDNGSLCPAPSCWDPHISVQLVSGKNWQVS